MAKRVLFALRPELEKKQIQQPTEALKLPYGSSSLIVIARSAGVGNEGLALARMGLVEAR